MDVRGLPYRSFPAKVVFALQHPEFAEGHSPNIPSPLVGVRQSRIDVVQRALPSGDASTHLGAATVGCCVLWTSSCSKMGMETVYLVLIFV